MSNHDTVKWYNVKMVLEDGIEHYCDVVLAEDHAKLETRCAELKAALRWIKTSGVLDSSPGLLATADAALEDTR